MRDMRFESPINAKEAFYSMASKAKQRDFYAKIRFEREPWYLTEKKIKEGRMKDAGTDEPMGL
jgi:hypothetical protein